MQIKIIAPDIWPKDAVGNFCLDLANLLTNNEIKVQLYAQHFSTDETPDVKEINNFFDDVEENDVIFLSYSIYDPYLGQILALPNKKICYFHGVTPPELLEEYEPVTAELCRKSQEQFPLLAQFDVLMANSEFIANDLRKYVGADREIKVVPPVFNTRFLFQEKCPDRADNNENLTFLYVGRVVPHKKVEDAIGIVKQLQENHPNIKLNIVGDTPNHTYLEALNDTIRNLDLIDQVSFMGKVDDKQLHRFYCESDVFITMSEHEGFCIPVLEAIYFGIPVVLRGGNAAEEVAGEYGIVVNNKSIASVTAMIKNKPENYRDYIEKILVINTIELWLAILKETGVKL